MALDENDSGMATGYAYGPESMAFIHAGTQTRLLRIEGVDRSWGLAINTAGDVLMKTWTDEREGAYFYHQGRFAALPAPAADTRVDPVGLNDAGQIAVTLWTPSGPQAAIYSDGRYQTLTKASESLSAVAFNNRGWMLLREALPGGDTGDTFLYRDGTVYRLEDLLFPCGAAKWDNKLSFGLSDAGHIVGFGTYNGRVQRSFIATPVPEPSTVVLILAGLGVIGSAVRRLTACPHKLKAAGVSTTVWATDSCSACSSPDRPTTLTCPTPVVRPARSSNPRCGCYGLPTGTRAASTAS